MLSLRLFSPSISLLSVHCFMLCRALRGGKEGIVLKNIRVFWLKDTKLICFTEPGSTLFDNCTSVNKHRTHGQIHHVDHQTLAICSPDWGVSFAIRECEFGQTHGNTGCFFHWLAQGWRNDYSSHWTGKSVGAQHWAHWGDWTPQRPGLETEAPRIITPNLGLVAGFSLGLGPN